MNLVKTYGLNNDEEESDSFNIVKLYGGAKQQPEQGVYTPKKEGHWEGWIKPSLKELGEAATKGTAETIASLGSSMLLWPVSKSAGIWELMKGGTAEQAKSAEERFANMAYKPTSPAAQGATNIVGKATEAAVWPAKKFGEGVEQIVGPKTGYVSELAAELATFKMIGSATGSLKSNINKTATSKTLLGKKLKELTPEERTYVNDVAKKIAEPVNLVKENVNKKTPFEEAYEKQKDIWFQEKDGRLFDADVESRLLKKDIIKQVKENKSLKSITEKPEKIDEAIQIYIDLQRKPNDLAKYYDKLTTEQKKVVDLSQNLPAWAKDTANQIKDSYNKVGIEAEDMGVIRNLIDNYAARKWDLEGKGNESSRTFGTRTGHSKQRRFDTVLEGWANGYDLKIKTATENLRTYKHEVIKTIEDKRFLSELRKLKTIDGDPLITTKQLDGYIEVEHPNMSVWEWAGKAGEDSQAYGKNFMVGKGGDLFENRRLYAPKDVAKNLNNMLGASKLKNIPGADVITKYNAIAKAWVLQSSLFHHIAFMRSYYLPGESVGRMFDTPRAAYKKGLASIESSDPVVREGVRNGLTLGLKQDWEEGLLREKTAIGRVLDKTAPTKYVKDRVNKFRETQASFLFGKFGAGLKARAYMLEFKEQLKKYPDQNPDVIAKRVARLINDDFGGLHLQRMGRNPTLQHLFRLVALAPDWTESNVRTMVKTIKNKTGDAAELNMYRKFWAGALVKIAGATAVLNYAMSGGDVQEMMDNYEKAWESGNMNWTKIDITPVYKMFGGDKDIQKYFSVGGHFMDPFKFMADPVKSAKYKQSIVGGTIFEGLAGTDWAGRGFTTIEDLLKEGETVGWGPKTGPVNWEQFPSYALSQLMGAQPIQVQNMIGYMNGEMDGFDALSKSIGLNTTTTYEKKKKKGGLFQ